MWVIRRVHRGTTYGRSYTQPTSATGFTQVDQVMVFITDDTDGGAAILQDFTDFA
jgi:hypothetical protein